MAHRRSSRHLQPKYKLLCCTCSTEINTPHSHPFGPEFYVTVEDMFVNSLCCENSACPVYLENLDGSEGGAVGPGGRMLREIQDLAPNVAMDARLTVPNVARHAPPISSPLKPDTACLTCRWARKKCSGPGKKPCDRCTQRGFECKWPDDIARDAAPISSPLKRDIACLICRWDKAECSGPGKKPCDRCTHRGFECKWPDDIGRDAPPFSPPLKRDPACLSCRWAKAECSGPGKKPCDRCIHRRFKCEWPAYVRKDAPLVVPPLSSFKRDPACRNCRWVKTQCSGPGRKPCDRCAHYGIECKWPDEVGRDSSGLIP